MASLLGQFFTSIKGSQEDIASKSLAYILEKSNSAKNVINDIIKNKTNLTFENLKYITQSVGKNKERPDISGIDTHGNERIIIETKFWSSLTDNQPIEYLNRLKEQTVLIFVCPKLRELSLLGEIEIKIQHSNITYKNNNGFEVEGNKYIFVIDWQSILVMIKQTLIENNEIKLVSDIDQIIGFCEIIDNNTFLPIQDYDLSPSTAKRIISYYDLLDKIYDKLQKEIKAYKGTLKATGQRFGYTIYFMINNYCITLELHFLFWQKIADTPFWIAIKPEWNKPQPVDFRDKLKKISAKTNIKIYENDFNDLLYFALKPKLNEVEDVVIDDIVRQIIMIMGEL
jgi:hypothetical protein